MIQNDKIRVAYRVIGRVQGVGFRWFVVNEAKRLGLSGWVRNTPDGNVEIEAEGTAEAMAEFERCVAAGPRSARVQQLLRLEPGAHPLNRGFEIVR